MKINGLNSSIALYNIGFNNINFQKKKATDAKRANNTQNNPQNNATIQSILKMKAEAQAESETIQKQAEVDIKKGDKKAKEVTALYQKGLENDFESFTQDNRTIKFEKEDIFNLRIKEYNTNSNTLLRKTEFSLLSHQPRQITEYIGSSRNEYEFMANSSESETEEKPVILKIKKGIEAMAEGLTSTQKELTFDKNANLKRFIKGHRQTPVSDIYLEHFYFADNKLNAYSKMEENFKNPKTTIAFQLLFKKDNPDSFTCLKDYEKTPTYSKAEVFNFVDGVVAD